MRKTARKLSLALLTRLLCCVTPLAPGCCPVLPQVPKVACPLPPEPTVVRLSPGSAGDLVTLTVPEAVALAVYLVKEAEWHQIAQACLGVIPAKPVSPPVPSVGAP